MNSVLFHILERSDYNSSDVSKTASRQHEKQNTHFIYKNYSTVSTESSESQFSSRVTRSPSRVHPGNQSCLSQKTYLRNSSIKFLNVNVMSFPYHSLEEHLRWKTTGRFYDETHLYVWVTRKTRYTCVLTEQSILKLWNPSIKLLAIITYYN